MTLLGLLLRFLLRAFGLIASEPERPVGPPARVTYVRPSDTGLHHVGWPMPPVAGTQEQFDAEKWIAEEGW